MSLAFTFPGQGSQSVGMLSALGDHYQSVEETFTEAADVLGVDLWSIVRDGPEDALNQTEITQPAMLAAGFAIWRVWKSEGGPDPRFMAGHSLGEYTALLCAEALDYPSALRLVAERARLMQSAVPSGVGAMAAVLGLADEVVEQACIEAAELGVGVVEPVNYNAPGQVVIAGRSAAVDAAIERAKAHGAKRAVPLPVSVPSHCSLMSPAAEALAERLETTHIRRPKVPVIHNVDAASHSEPEAIRDVLARQVFSPVQWVHSIRRLATQGVGVVVEAGPGKVLSNLARRIDRGLRPVPIFDPDSLVIGLREVAVA